MATIYVSRESAVSIIQSTNGRIFTAAFHRRTKSTVTEQREGDVRVMNCRIGVHKDLKGGPDAYDPAAHDLFWVYDLQAKTENKRRSINLRGLVWIKADGVTYRFL